MAAYIGSLLVYVRCIGSRLRCDCNTETCRSCFNVNYNIAFKTFHLCIRWRINNFRTPSVYVFNFSNFSNKELCINVLLVRKEMYSLKQPFVDYFPLQTANCSLFSTSNCQL